MTLLLQRAGVDWYALFVVAIALGWLVFLEAYDRMVIRPRQRRDDREEITRFWHEAFERWQRVQAQRLADTTANVVKQERRERVLDEEQTAVQRAIRCPHGRVSCAECWGFGGGRA